MKQMYKTLAILVVLSLVLGPLFAQHHQAGKSTHGHDSDCGSCPKMGAGKQHSGAQSHAEDKCGPNCKVFHHLGGSGYYIKYANELELRMEQVNQIEQIWIDHKKMVISKESDLKIAQLELRQILDENSPDYKKARSKVSQINSINEAICLSHLESIEKAQNTLTDEQLLKLKQLNSSGLKRHKSTR